MADKKCSKCGALKAISAFDKKAASKDGYRSRCKSCRIADRRDYYLKNTESVTAYNKRWAAGNKGKKLAYSRKSHRKRRIEKPEEVRAESKRKDPGKVKAWKRAFYLRHPEKHRAWGRNNYARRKRANGKHSTEDVNALLISQRGKCAYCLKDIRAGFHVDHIKPLFRGGSNYKENLQLLCRKCNLSKGSKEPHEFARFIGRLL